jgi:tetratricopeptide (TPR) repeat protein
MAATTCPGTDTIAELVCRRLDASTAMDVEAHVADCAACRRLVGTLAPGSLPYLGELATDAELPAAGPHRYVIRKLLARGGMGRISIADDTLLGRTVAIKELLAPSAALEARFHRELALTARLQHPSIVSIHDAGTWPGGEPFYVMRLVSGEPLDRVIARHGELDARLALLPHAIAMVDALAYAHSQRIIHRDLKPANVLIGDFGETVVIDWGLAKDLGANDEPDAGVVLGTPAYMAPEQARGEPADERADVYALGAVLYHLLGGRPPHSAESVDELLRAVRDTAPVALAERVRGVPLDLVAIVHKAMSARPEDRYANAGELAVDLKRFERGQLVGAHHYTAGQLARRWLRRYRTAVTVAAVAMVVLVALSIAGVRRILAEQHRAEQHRADAEDLSRFMLTTLHQQLRTAGKLDLLGPVADKERAYYDAHQGDQPYARSIALNNLGEVLDAKGDKPGALAVYRESLALAERLAQDGSAGPMYRHARSVCHSRIGDVLMDQHDAAGAAAEFRASVEIDRALADAQPDDSKLHDALVTDAVRLGHALASLGRSDDAIAEYREGIAIATRFAALLPKDDAWQIQLAESHGRLGDMRLKQGDLAGGLVEQRAALAAAIRGSELAPEDPDHEHAVADYHLAVGAALEANDPASALVEYRAALVILEALIGRDPSNTVWQRSYSITESSIGTVLLGQGDSEGALAAYRAALASVEHQVAQAPASDGAQRELFVMHTHIGQVLFTRGDLSGALPEFQAALPIAERLGALAPTNVDTQRDLSAALSDLGSVLLAQHDVAGALDRFRAAEAISKQWAAKDPTNGEVARDLFEGTTDVGDALLVQGDSHGALAEYQAALDVATASARRAPEDPDVQLSLRDAHSKLGDALLANGEDATGEYRTALAIATRVFATNTSADWQEAVADGHTKLGDALRARRDPAARGEYEAAFTTATALAKRDPHNASWKRKLDELRVKLH